VRVLLLSDIHANLEALGACLDAAPGYDVVANLGDLVGYNASPNEVMDRARTLGDFFVRGNHDRACSGLSSLENFNSLAAIGDLWTRTMLTRANQQWLRELPVGPERLKGLENVNFVHSSPLHEDDYILSLADAMEPLRRFPVPLTFIGHTHVQGGFGLQDGQGIVIHPEYKSRDGAETSELKLNSQARYLVNPGSVGQPRDRDWRSAFALFDSEVHTVTFYRVPYDVERTQRRILDADLPEQLAARLAVGR
jgi:diadenosine tetraphosphatase ApaH/serine/threonine PP2A family protein phosphatase